MAKDVPYRRNGLAEQRRNDLNRIDAMTVKVSRVSGRVLIVHQDTAVAETSVDIRFPVVFTEMPVFLFGSAMGVNHRALAGEYPELSATVTGWETVGEVVGGFDGRFIAATVAVITKGQVNQQIWLNYSFEGKAIRNPLNQLGDLGAL